MVGEAPGFQEAAYGAPFKGPSGKLLKSVLAHHGYQEKEVVFTNAVLCRPPDNATPPKAAIAACRGRLYAELGSSGAFDVVALGGTAASVLVDDSRTITHLRVGPPKHPTRALDGSEVARVVPTWHPAYCLRTADAFPALVRDIGKLKRDKVSTWTDPKWIAISAPRDAMQACHELMSRTDKLVLDIEVGIDKDVSFDHPNAYEMLCIGVGYEAKGVVVFYGECLKDEASKKALGDLFRAKKLIAHNGKFDLAGLYPLFGPLELWFDTMLANYALDERPGNHGLKVLAVEELGTPPWEEEIRKYVPRRGNYADIPQPILHKYNALDVGATWALYEMLSEALDRGDVRRVHDHLVAASNQLMYLELNGIAIDLPYNFKLGDEFSERLGTIERELDEIVTASTDGTFTSINPRSPKQVAAYLDSQGLQVPSTNVDTLGFLLEQLDSSSPSARFVSTLLRHRREQKLASTYVQGIRKRVYRGRVYSTFLLHGSTSGRLASRNPNLQNVVRDKSIRRQFVTSRPGNILIQADYKQAEGRVICTLAEDAYLRDVLSDPVVDIFDSLSDQLYGPGNWRKEVERVRTKAFFYGLSYGREAASIAAEYGMPLHSAQKLMNEFMSLIPATVAWQRRVRQTVLAGDDLVTYFGRRRRFHLITERNKGEVLREALSFLPQSTASDICLRALIRLRPMLRGMAFIRLTIHDALIVECAENHRDEVAQLLTSTMVDEGREFTDYVPFPVDVSSGPSWGDL